MIPFVLQVSLLNQERIIETIRNAIEEKLMNSNTTRIFQTQVLQVYFTLYICICIAYIIYFPSMHLYYPNQYDEAIVGDKLLSFLVGYFRSVCLFSFHCVTGHYFRGQCICCNLPSCMTALTYKHS